MTQPARLIISNISVGQQTYEKPFFINNDAFPQLDNGICWRQRLMKKPGSEQIGRLTRNFMSTTLAQMTTAGLTTTIADLLNDANINQRATQPNASIQPGSVMISTSSAAWNDLTTEGVLTAASGNAAAGTINYATGQVVLNFVAPDGGGNAITATFGYYPSLPVLGIEQFESDVAPTAQIDFPVNVFFDQMFSYEFNGTNFFDVSFYKITHLPVTWSGGNFQQFFSANYYRAMFVTNNNPGFHQLLGTYVSGSGSTTVVFTFVASGAYTLKVGDWLYFYEWTGTVNGMSGQVSNIGSFPDITVTFPGSVTVSGSGKAQLLTNNVAGSGDGIRWFDGTGSDPNGKPLGWVNFAPPLDNLFSSATTYLMGARMIIPFGNRLLAIGTYEGTSSQGVAGAVYYGNRIRYCEVNATPFYSPPTPNTGSSTFVQGFDPLAWASNIQGYGGFIDLDTTQRIISASITQGSLILGLESEQRRMSNTGIETQPYTLDVINPEYGSAGTYGIIPMDRGILTVGEYGLLTTSSYASKRFDEKIIDQVFSINANNNGFDRISGARDFYHEVVYFSYVSDDADASNIYPNRTIVFNYREESFAIWKESFTTYGLYKVSSKQTWQTYFTPWEFWVDNWEDLGGDQYVEPFVAGGNAQGFVMAKWADQSFNDPSLFIQAVTNNMDGTYTIESANHNVEQGMYIGFWAGVPSDTIDEPSFILPVVNVIDIDNFKIGIPPTVPVPGIWQMSIVDQINIYSKQFPSSWSNAMKTRIGAQKYFLDKTTSGQFTLNIYGSQSSLNLNGFNSDLAIFTAIVRTMPDVSLGLNDSASSQTQIWHRLSSSAIGDTVQLQFTMSDAQMTNVEVALSPWVLYSAVLDLYPSRTLA